MIGLSPQNDVSTLRAIQPSLSSSSRSNFATRLQGRFNVVGVTNSLQKHQLTSHQSQQKISKPKKKIIDYQELYQKQQEDIERDALRLQELQNKLLEVNRL